MLLIDYKIANLAELQQMIDDVLNTARTAAGRQVAPEEISILTADWNHASPQLIEEKLSDGSKVYNVEF